jgi:DNA-binding FadR family transcriptional regulator
MDEVPDRDDRHVGALAVDARRAARLAATRADEDACRQLADYLQTMRDHADDPAAYTAADLGFHIAVARAARNPFLATMITPLVQVIVEGIFESHGAADAVDLGISAHSEILDRIEQRDPQGAMRAMEEHLLASRRLFPGQVMERLVGSGD